MRREEEKTKVIGEIEKMKANFKNKFCKTQIKTNIQNQTGITLLVLVITIVLNCSYLAMDQMNKIEKI